MGALSVFYIWNNTPTHLKRNTRTKLLQENNYKIKKNEGQTIRNCVNIYNTNIRNTEVYCMYHTPELFIAEILQVNPLKRIKSEEDIYTSLMKVVQSKQIVAIIT